jgi:hypothetical protein
MSKKKQNTSHRFNKFKGYYIEDLDCQYCLYYKGRKHGCSLDTCCCEAERELALERGWWKREEGTNGRNNP